MNVRSRNALLLKGVLDEKGLWPQLEAVKEQPFLFPFDFGLEKLPLEPGLIVVRGPRQFGKSTWLEMQLKQSIESYGAGSSFYLNGDEIVSGDDFSEKLMELIAIFRPGARQKRLFIDEITAIPDWEKVLKRLIDDRSLREVLVVTTGSKAADLRHGVERLPGRRGKIERTNFLFLPLSYATFVEKCGSVFGDKAWIAYLLSGGSPLACNELYRNQRLPEYWIQLTRDWVLGDIVGAGRSRLSLINILQVLYRCGGQPVGFAKLAREAGLANNTVAAGYIEQLADLLCILPLWPWDPGSNIFLPRKPCKFHFINLAMAVAFSPHELRSVADFEQLVPEVQAQYLEWLVGQELWRRRQLAQASSDGTLGFWQSKEHEIDFVTHDRNLYEVKRGQAGPLDFTWFGKIFSQQNLTVICQNTFQTRQIQGLTLPDFLLGGPIPNSTPHF